jgi:hypothetical protein
MVRYSMVFLIIAIIALLVSLSNTLLVATSVIPGWHTTIYPPFFWVSVLQLTWICLLPLFYLILEKRNRKISKKAFLIHLFCTVMVFVSADRLISYLGYYMSRIAITLPFVLFTLGQLWFPFIVLKKQSRL